jgi:light-regulated signal transduction histidine kinase (bacteriophytochrome)
MPKIQFTPVDVSAANEIKRISKNLSDVVDFVISTSENVSSVVAQINKLIPALSQKFDDSKLNEQMEKIEKSIKALDLNYDDTSLKKELSKIKSSITAYDDAPIKKSIEEVKKAMPNIYNDSEINDKIELLASEIESLKRTTVSNQKEIRSYRKEAVRNINLLDQRVNDLTEVK